MSKRNLTALLLLVTAVALFFITPTGRVVSQEISSVFVTNWPGVQTVDGAVAINRPVPLSHLVKFEDVTVPPVKSSNTTRLVEAGTLQTEGFPNVVLSLHGQVKGWVQNAGDVGVILVPDESSIQFAFDELGLIHFALYNTASAVSSQTPYFSSVQSKHLIGFKSYKVLLFNQTDKTITANVFAYLTN